MNASAQRLEAGAALEPEQLAEAAAALALDKKAADVVILDLREIGGYTDFFVVCSGTSDRQTKAIHDGIHLGLKQGHGLLPRRVEGAGEARWIVMDYLDIVVHVFQGEVREHYRLEAVWGDVPRMDVDPERLAALVTQPTQPA